MSAIEQKEGPGVGRRRRERIANLEVLNLELVGELPHRTTGTAEVRCKLCDTIDHVSEDRISSGKNPRPACRNCHKEAKRSERDARLRREVERHGFEPLEMAPARLGWGWRLQHVGTVDRAGCRQGLRVSVDRLRAARKRGSTGCQNCAGNRRKSQDLAAKELLAFGVRLLGTYVNARTGVEIECLICGEKDSRRFDDIRASGVGCSYCAKKKMSSSYARELLSRKGLRELEPFQGSTKRWAAVCTVCGNEVKVLAHDLDQGQGGCTNCASGGFNDAAPGILYLIFSASDQLFKIGITNTSAKPDRLKAFQRIGFAIVETHTFPIGRNARSAESALKAVLRADGLLGAARASRMEPHGGHTETVDGRKISRGELVGLYRCSVASFSKSDVPIALQEAAALLTRSQVHDQSRPHMVEVRRQIVAEYCNDSRVSEIREKWLVPTAAVRLILRDAEVYEPDRDRGVKRPVLGTAREHTV